MLTECIWYTEIKGVASQHLHAFIHKQQYMLHVQFVFTLFQTQKQV